MTAVETGTLLLTEDRARTLANQIIRHFDDAWALIEEFHDGEGWRALGHKSFKAWVEAELTIPRSMAYRLLDKGRLVKAIAERAGVPDRDISKAVSATAAGELRDHHDAVAGAVADRVEQGDDARQAAAEEIGKARAALHRDTPADLRRRLENAQHGRGLFPTGRARDLLREIARQLLERDPADAADVWRAALAAKSNVPALERVLGEIESAGVGEDASDPAPEADAASDGELIEGPSGDGSSPADDYVTSEGELLEDVGGNAEVGQFGQPLVEDRDEPSSSDGEHHAREGEQEGGAAHQVAPSASVPADAQPAADGDPESADGPPTVDTADDERDPSATSAAPSHPEPSDDPPAAAGSEYGNTEQGRALQREQGSKPKIDAVGIGRSVFAAMSVGIPENVDHIAAGIRTLPADERELLRERAARSKAQAERVLLTIDALERDGL